MKKYSKKNNKRKIKMKGGVIKKNENLTSWQSVYNMIKSSDSILESISYNSLVGFVFKLYVEEEHSEFLGLNNTRTNFNKPIKSLIFKIVVIDTNNKRTIIPDYVDNIHEIYKKSVEDKDNFIQEAFVQQNIYLNTINPNGNYICPSVIDLSLFKNDDAKILIDDLMNTIKLDNECTNMLIYLKDVLQNPDFELGMIAMELVDENYKALYKIRNSDIYRYNCEYAIAEIIILFIKLKLVNYDCHSGNILANKNGDSKSLLIDFGRIIDLKNVPENVKQQYNIFTGTNFDDDFNAINAINVTEFYNITIENYKDYIENIAKISWIFRFIAFIDFSTNYTYFHNPPIYNFTQPQMNNLIRFLYGNGLNTENMKTFKWYQLESNTITSIISICNKIEELTKGIVGQRNIFSDTAMKAKISNKKFFDKNILDENTLYKKIRQDGDCDPNDETCWTRTLRRVGDLFGFTRKKRSRESSSISKTRKQKRE